MNTDKATSNGWGIIHKKIMKDTRLTIEAKGISITRYYNKGT
ncbi:MAG: hypothetical protein N2169_07040 [bacterium]|nr:hypothetical protein [bacterium]